MDNVDKLDICDDSGGVVISVKVVPGGSRDRVAGVLGDCLKVATSAPPEKGKANKAVVKILADALNIDKRDVEIISGHAGGRKKFRFNNLSSRAARQRLKDSRK